MSFMGTKSDPIERSIKAEEDHAWRQVRQFAVPYQCRKYADTYQNTQPEPEKAGTIHNQQYPSTI